MNTRVLRTLSLLAGLAASWRFRSPRMDNRRIKLPRFCCTPT